MLTLRKVELKLLCINTAQRKTNHTHTHTLNFNMTNVQSKLFTSVACTCKEFHHPWTDKCVNAIAGILMTATPYCFRVYTVVYMLSLIMRHRIPTKEDLKRTALGILQSTGFLTTNSFTFILYNCLLRNIIGKYYCLTASFVPCFLASWTAIVVERPQRRPLLALYVANVATETLWNMLESRGWVRSIPHAQTMIFGVSISMLLYLYRLGLHKSSCKDSIYNILRIFVGKTEEGPIKPPAAINPMNERSRPPPINFYSINGCVQAYLRFLEAKHESCPHTESCFKYSIYGGIKPFLGGVSLQVALKLIMNIKKIVQFKMNWRKTFIDKKTLNLGIFLGSFSFLYKAVSCTLRHGFGFDDPRFAIPAGLIGSIAFTQYPDVTVALYVMWKMLQIVYNFGIQKGILPKVPGFTIFLYSFCTSILFHAGILEPNNLRPSYYKFLQAISGGRLALFNVEPFDAFGLNTSQNVKEVMQRLNVVIESRVPKYAFA